MSRRRFSYPPEFVTLPEYTAHSGQMVEVVRADAYRTELQEK